MATITGTNKYDGLVGTIGPRGPVLFMALRRFAALRLTTSCSSSYPATAPSP